MAKYSRFHQPLCATALLWALQTLSLAKDVEVVGSFSTIGLTPSPASITVDMGRNVLLLGGADGSIVEVSREGFLLDIVIPAGLIEGKYPRADRAITIVPSLELIYCAGGAPLSYVQHIYKGTGEYVGGFGIFGAPSVQGLLFEPRAPIGVLHMLDKNYSQIFSFTLNAAGDFAGTRYSYALTLPYEEQRALSGIVLLPEQHYFLLSLREAQLLLVPINNPSPAHGEVIWSEVTGRIDLGPLGIKVIDDLAFDPVQEHLLLTDSSQELVFELAFVHPALFHRGDPDESGELNLADAVNILRFLFQGGPPAPRCAESSDSNNDGQIDVSDGIFLLRFLFSGGPQPPPPGPPGSPCGAEPDFRDSLFGLGCAAYGGCR